MLQQVPGLKVGQRFKILQMVQRDDAVIVHQPKLYTQLNTPTKAAAIVPSIDYNEEDAGGSVNEKRSEQSHLPINNNHISSPDFESLQGPSTHEKALTKSVISVFLSFSSLKDKSTCIMFKKKFSRDIFS
jgi:hypothetical protein